MNYDEIPDMTFRIKLPEPIPKKLSRQILVPGNRFKLDGAMVYNMTRGDMITIKIGTAKIKLHEDNRSYKENLKDDENETTSRSSTTDSESS